MRRSDRHIPGTAVTDINPVVFRCDRPGDLDSDPSRLRARVKFDPVIIFAVDITLHTEVFYDALWKQDADGFALGPVFSFDNTVGHFNRFTEKHAGLLNLTYTGETARHTVFGSGGQARYHGAGLGAHHIDAGIRVAWERVHGDRFIDTDAYLDVEGAVFTPTAALLDRDRIAISLDTKVYFTEQLFGYVRYDTRRGENLIENEGWAGVTFKF